jgi:hypothetical protein
MRECDPLTGNDEKIRPGELVHVDVKKLGKIPDGGGWRAWGREMGSTAAGRRARPGCDYAHFMVDDYSRLAYSEVLTDEKASPARDSCRAP